ncbi:MAG TPA: TadE family type IV pilus minor pilin [Acidimicrobiia bacterium]|nr:TadE family type IV pilus minor pilin [Acidimicrobiia bacterium]
MTGGRRPSRARRGKAASPRCRSARGQATVEFAFLLPLVVLAALAVIQVALVVRDQMGVVHAAREAARAVSVDTDPTSAIRAARRTLPHAEVSVSDRPRVGGEISVTVRYHSVTSVPLVGVLFPDPDLSASATMRVER